MTLVMAENLLEASFIEMHDKDNGTTPLSVLCCAVLCRASKARN